jgi:hypothetical protein
VAGMKAAAEAARPRRATARAAMEIAKTEHAYVCVSKNKKKSGISTNSSVRDESRTWSQQRLR